ncbi:MAG TPA: malate dehydrogenase [Dehalococcoidia bacterium]|nr:malate dehydrogenase [Dehalococcoidia bacterium]
MLRKKISVIGAGSVGAACVRRLVERDYADIILMDIIQGLPQGKALDILESAPILNFNSHLIGTNSYQETANSDVVIITSGSGRKPGMTRDELLLANMKIITEVTRNVVSHSPNCIIIMVTNPVDAMTHLAIHTSQFSRNRVFGLSGVLDSARLSSFIAAELKVSVKDVSACVLGQHGSNMVIIPRLSTVSGVPITKLLPRETIERLEARTISGGEEIVNLLKTGSAFYAPSAAVAQMVEAIILDKKEVLPCATYLEGEYGIKDSVIGVPVKLGRSGIEEIIELELTMEEKQVLATSAEAVRELINIMKGGSK